jgi:integrase
MPKLTKEFIDKVKPPQSGYKIHWDGGYDGALKGFGLRVSPAGKKVFVAQGRVLGKAVIVTVGPYGLWTESQAREDARQKLQDMRNGINHRAVKKAAIAQKVEDEARLTTLQQVLDFYLSSKKLKPVTAAEYKRHVERTFADWKNKPIASITKKMVQERHSELVRSGLNGKKGAPASANSAFVTLRILINFAQRQYFLADDETPIITSNPVAVLSDHWVELGDRTSRNIGKQFIGEVWNGLNEARQAPINHDALCGIDLAILALLTGARRNELAHLTWNFAKIDDNNPTKNYFHLPNPKNGKEIKMPLSSQAVALLKSRLRMEGNHHVFPTRSRTNHIMDARAAMRMVSSIVGQRLSLHDMRRTYTNIAIKECLIEKFRVDIMTNHKPNQSDVTARKYADLMELEWLQPEIQKVSDWIEEQGRIAAGDNVVPIRA